MTPAQQRENAGGGTNSASGAIHLLLTGDEMQIRVESPAKVMEEIELRATQIGSVLEAIFHEPHGRPDWGINE